MDTEKLHAGFARNRRFLIAVSFALSAFYVLGLRFSQVTLLGNSANLLHPERVEALGWAIWLWAFLQYIVWVRDVGAWREFSETVHDDCARTLGSRMVREYDVADAVKDKMIQEWGGNTSIPPSALENAAYVKRYSKVNGDGKQVPRWFDVEITAHARMPENYAAESRLRRIELLIDPSRWRRYYFRALVTVLLTRRFVFEYVAPLVIASLPIIFWAVSHSRASKAGFI